MVRSEFDSLLKVDVRMILVLGGLGRIQVRRLFCASKHIIG